MKLCKKTLSVFLSLLMTLSCVSVCFTPISAAAVTNSELQGAFNAITNTSDLTGGDGTLLNAAEKLYEWVSATASTATGSTTGSYTSSSKTYKVVPADNNSTVNLNAGADAIVGSSYAALIDKLIPTSGVTDDSNASVKDTTSSASYGVTSGVNASVTVSADLDKVLLTYASLADVPSTILLSATYNYSHTVKQENKSYTTGSLFWKTTYYRCLSWHHLSAKPTRTNVKTDTDARANLQAVADCFTTELLNKTVADLVLNDKMTATEINALVSKCNTALNRISSYSDAVKNHFFDMAAINAFMENCEFAKTVINVMPTIDSLKSAIEAGYDKENLSEMTAIYGTQKANYDYFAAADADVIAYVQENFAGYDTLTVAAAKTFVDTLARDIDMYNIKALKAEIDGDVASYSTYDTNGIDEGTVTSAMITAAIADISADITRLNSFNSALVTEICGADYSKSLVDFKNNLTYLGSVAGYNDKFAAEYKKYAEDVKLNFNTEAESKDLMVIEQSYEAWYKGVKALIDEMKTELGDELANALFDGLNEPMIAYMEQAYSVLNARVTAQIDTAYNAYQKIKTEYGDEITMLNMSLYGELKYSIGAIDTEVYSYLKSSAYNKLSAETVAKYDELQNIIAAYNSFKETIGFDSYEQYEIEEIVRPESEDEIARENNYNVTDENVENLISALEAVLKNDEVKALLGELLAKEGEEAAPFDIGALVNDLLAGIYSDDIINAVVQYVYPVVAKEFAKVWADLPDTITVEDIDTGFLGIKADVTADLTIDTVEKATASVGVWTFPVQLGELIAKNYPQYANVANALKSVTTASNYDPATGIFTNPWEDSHIITETEDGSKKLNLVWGVTDRESFIDAAVAALSGLENLLLALVSNIAYDNNVKMPESGDYRGSKIGTGAGSAKVGINLNLVIDPISLVFRCSANDGYDNVIAPLFELLGVPVSEIPHGESLTSTRMILEDGLFGMLDKVIAMLAENPLDTILNLLPNLAYILEAGMIQDVLGLLQTDITYEADAKYSVIGIVNGNMEAAMKSDSPININIGDMVDLQDLGLDVTSLNALWGMLMDMLVDGGTLPKALPCPNGGMIATMGKLTWKDTNRSGWIYTPAQTGKAAYIEANKADLLIYLVRYVFENDIIGMFLDKEQAAAIVKEILTNIAVDPDMTIAAVVELLNQIKYDTLEEYTWFEQEIGGTVEGHNPADLVYLSYTNNWNKEAADYAIANINQILDTVLTVAGVELDLSKTFADLIGGLFTNANITAIAKLLSGIGSLESPLPELIKSLANIDLSSFAQYADVADDATWGFEDGDRDAFVEKLLQMLEPFGPVLDFILAGENLELIDGEVELIGYNGYDNAIVPILEALGATPGEATLESIIASLVEVVDKVIADPVNEIINILPGVLYFIQSDGLTVAVRNLLQPIYVILDTIRPIYVLDLNDLLAETGVNLNKLDVTFIVELLEDLTGLNLARLEKTVKDVCTVIGVDYTSASAFVGEGKKGAYTEDFDKADMLTVVISLALEMLGDECNAEAFDKLIGAENFTGALLNFFNGVEPATKAINWMYYFGTDTDLSDYDFDTGINIEPTTNALEYPNNWTRDTAKYVDDNLGEIEKTVVKLIDENYNSLADLISDKLVIYSTENVQAIVDLIAGLLGDLDAKLIEIAGVALNADLEAIINYKAPEGIDTADEFAAALADILATIPDVAAWLLFGKDIAFFTGSKTDADGNFIYNDIIKINGAEGYKKGLAPVLEALGVENLPTEITETTIEDVLKATFARLDEILANPVDEVLELLPNVIYFINADGVSASVNNLLSAVYALLDQLKLLGVEVDLTELLGFDLTKLGADDIFALAEDGLGLELAPVTNIVRGLCVGTIKSYNSISGEPAFKMTYNGDKFARYDMITIIATVLLRTIEVEENEAPLKELMGEDIYTVILNFYDMFEVPMQDISYIYTDKADTDFTFSALETSEIYGNNKYGPMYTQEMAQYIADNIGDFIDNIIYLLGIKINGENVDGLEDLLNGLVGGGLYNSGVAQSIVDALVGVVDGIEGLADGAGKHIIAVLKTSLGVDLAAYESMKIEEFEDDRAAFEKAVIQIAEPVYPLLKWLLADEDLSFFVDEDGSDLITLKGAEGYAFGIIPLLEVLDCKDILTTEEYYEAVKADDSVLIMSILSVIFDRLDVILTNPAEEILSMLPNIIYFINSNGVDTVVKNTLNAVYTVLNAIEPIAKIDLYEIIGLDLSTLTFEKIFDMALVAIAENTGYEFTSLDANAIAELTVGKLVSYTSANGKKAYKMVYQSEKAPAEMVTVVMRLAVTFIMHENNREMLIGVLKDNLGMSEDAEKYLRGVLDTMASISTETYLGMDQALATIYYLFYGVDIGADKVANGLKDVNAEWKKVLEKLGKSDDPEEATIGNLLAEFMDKYLDDIITSEGIAPNGLIAFFQKIIAFFQKMLEFFRSMF
ncbi:MAG: hypothetical protein ACI4GC_05750 [Acutalibacteraceae bacterium]